MLNPNVDYLFSFPAADCCVRTVGGAALWRRVRGVLALVADRIVTQILLILSKIGDVVIVCASFLPTPMVVCTGRLGFVDHGTPLSQGVRLIWFYHLVLDVFRGLESFVARRSTLRVKCMSAKVCAGL